jgi:excisionase family DNA binding protein
VSSEREWMTVKEVAHELGISSPRVYQLIAENEIPGVYRTGKRTLRVDRAEFFEWLETRRISPPTSERRSR